MTATDELGDLIAALDRALAAEYTAEQRHGLRLPELFAPHMRFFVARRGEAAVGCGGVAVNATFAEVKRMFVRAEARGLGIARALLGRIERETMNCGLDVLRLETGTRQTAAIRLYERAGFRRCAVFGDYASLPPRAVATSVFYEKRLTGDAASTPLA